MQPPTAPATSTPQPASHLVPMRTKVENDLRQMEVPIGGEQWGEIARINVGNLISRTVEKIVEGKTVNDHLPFVYLRELVSVCEIQPGSQFPVDCSAPSLDQLKKKSAVWMPKLTSIAVNMSATREGFKKSHDYAPELPTWSRIFATEHSIKLSGWWAEAKCVKDPKTTVRELERTLARIELAREAYGEKATNADRSHQKVVEALHALHADGLNGMMQAMIPQAAKEQSSGKSSTFELLAQQLNSKKKAAIGNDLQRIQAYVYACQSAYHKLLENKGLSLPSIVMTNPWYSEQYLKQCNSDLGAAWGVIDKFAKQATSLAASFKGKEACLSATQIQALATHLRKFSTVGCDLPFSVLLSISEEWQPEDLTNINHPDIFYKTPTEVAKQLEKLKPEQQEEIGTIVKDLGRYAARIFRLIDESRKSAMEEIKRTARAAAQQG